MDELISSCATGILRGKTLSPQDAAILDVRSTEYLWDFLYWANVIRCHFFGRTVRVCSIVPARLGGCDQDCRFCAQSIHYNTPVDKKAKLLSDDEIITAAHQAKDKGAGNFGIVYSGKTVSPSEFARLTSLARHIRSRLGMSICAALGIIDHRQAQQLAQAGVARYNHNLETSRRHFGNIVTTHTYDQRIQTIHAAKSAGMGICAGGIFGIGETSADRLDLAFELARLGVDMVPLNFLHPIPGTPLFGTEPLKPLEILRIVALYRFILPSTHLKVAGGRTLNLRDMQSWIFYAGCTSIISGNYLTTSGRAIEDDLKMITDAGMETEVSV